MERHRLLGLGVIAASALAVARFGVDIMGDIMGEVAVPPRRLWISVFPSNRTVFWE